MEKIDAENAIYDNNNNIAVNVHIFYISYKAKHVTLGHGIKTPKANVDGTYYNIYTSLCVYVLCIY